MIFTTEDLLDEFYNKVKEDFPDLTKEQIVKICRNPFYYIRKQMSSGEFPLIHIKYLGKFLVYPGKVKALLRTYDRQLYRKAITPEEFKDRITNLKNFLLKNEEVSN